MANRILARGAARNAYTVRMARSIADIQAAQMLRFLVFNVELNEGLEASYHTCRDEDPFDEVCDHLLVESDGKVVGTYRLQTGHNASQKRGYCSEQEFDFTPFEPMRAEIIELGRACVMSEHRNLIVLGLLWRGIAAYARQHGSRYLIGCSSFNSQTEADGAALYAALSGKHRAPEAWQTQPLPGYRCGLENLADKPPRVPKLLSAYLSLGAKICAPPAIDRDFKTIDFLTLLDLETLPAAAQQLLA
ncbi:GNAT family N-acetyltransferase [Verrucomicrobiota bacterium sgz303538]